MRVSAASAGRAVMRRARVTKHEFVQSNECESERDAAWSGRVVQREDS